MEKVLPVPEIIVAHPATAAATLRDVEDLRRQSVESALWASDVLVTNPTIAEVATARPFCTFIESATLLAVARVPAAIGKEDVLLLCDEGA